MTETRKQYGSILYTQEQIDEIEAIYGVGFLARNPHYPAPGWYKTPTGGYTSWATPIKVLEELEKLHKDDKPFVPPKYDFGKW